MPRIILSLAQARTLQQDPTPWPGSWQFALDTPVPALPDSLLDPARAITGLEMIARGCTREQIALQLNLKDGAAMRQLYRLHEREQKHTPLRT
ncbi:hypothetical protein [Sphingomonas sp. R1]|uniref:hypothetical protein n=1 Tax=Sphingomonas sp. R1 TaxID=399176 RepID=UPI002225ADC2|nr:hypothetical protein [Sphingomonas sp. R1]UYY77512.1 hypothetical protein OIM94_00415 [Sphingomonas sp. R1]